MDHVLRTTTSATQAGDWALVLEAASHRAPRRRARRPLRAGHPTPQTWRRRPRRWPDSTPRARPSSSRPRPICGWSPLGLLCAIAFAAMLLVTGAREHASRWFAAGAASAQLITHGAWWRAVTALTLHADSCTSRVTRVGSLVFISAVGRWLGGGLGAILILASAAAGNLLTAVRHQRQALRIGRCVDGDVRRAGPGRRSAGGAAAAAAHPPRLLLGADRRRRWGCSRCWASPPASDYYAHLFGLGFGVAVRRRLGDRAAQARVEGAAPGRASAAGRGRDRDRRRVLADRVSPSPLGRYLTTAIGGENAVGRRQRLLAATSGEQAADAGQR